LKEMRRLATTLVNGDRTNIPVNHPIRWPGSLHRKATPRLCEIVSTEHLDNEIDLDEALAILQKAVGSGPLPIHSNNHALGPAEGRESDQQVALNISSKFAHLPLEVLGGDIPDPSPHAEPERIAAALAFIPNSKRLYVLCGEKIDGNEDDDLDWHGWNYTGMAMWRGTKGSPEGLAVPCVVEEVVEIHCRHPRGKTELRSPHSREVGGILQIPANAARRRHHLLARRPSLPRLAGGVRSTQEQRPRRIRRRGRTARRWRARSW